MSSGAVVLALHAYSALVRHIREVDGGRFTTGIWVNRSADAPFPIPDFKERFDFGSLRLDSFAERVLMDSAIPAVELIGLDR